MANQRIKANLIPSCDIYPVIHLAQYDVSDGTGKQVEIELYYGTDKFTIPSGSSITFRGTKRDKTGYSYEITKFSDNIATVDVKPQMTVLSGTHFAELRISKEMAKNPQCEFCVGCFTEKYPAPIPVSQEKSQFEKKINVKEEESVDERERVHGDAKEF